MVGAVAARPSHPPEARLARDAVRARLEELLLASGLAYGTGAPDPAVELAAEATPGARAFAWFAAGLVRTCARAASLSRSVYFVPGAAGIASDEEARARRGQLVAVLAAIAGEPEAAVRLFADPLGTPTSLVQRLAGKVAVHLSRRFLVEGGAFAGLPLLNGLCAIEVRACTTLAVAAFDRGRLSRAAAHVTLQTALRWRSVLVEALSALSQAQERGDDSRKGYDQVIRSQRLPAREARLLRRALSDPRPPEALAPELHSEALQRFTLTQVLLAALVDRRFEAGEVAFVDRLATALGVDAEHLALIEVAVEDFYRKNGEALAALRLAETAEGLPHALTTRVQEALTDNLDRLLQELRETGELAELLAKAGAGTTLTAAEKKKVREQLIDLAKTVPALAIFAAPGGALLLPILIKLLPRIVPGLPADFNLLPSSFADEPPRARALPAPLKRTGG